MTDMNKNLVILLWMVALTFGVMYTYLGLRDLRALTNEAIGNAEVLHGQHQSRLSTLENQAFGTSHPEGDSMRRELMPDSESDQGENEVSRDGTRTEKD